MFISYRFENSFPVTKFGILHLIFGKVLVIVVFLSVLLVIVSYF